MFVAEMSNAVEAAQKSLDKCFSKNNIAAVFTADLALLGELLEQVDPSDVNFENKGIFNKRKISNYWNSFDKAYKQLVLLYDKLGSDKRIINNTVITLEGVVTNFNSVYEEFEKTAAAMDTDVELMQQMAVSQNMRTMLDNAMNEYSSMVKTIDTVLNILKHSLDIAVLLAKSKTSVDTNNMGVFARETSLLRDAVKGYHK